jgi:hypothetical protein
MFIKEQITFVILIGNLGFKLEEGSRRFIITKINGLEIIGNCTAFPSGSTPVVLFSDGYGLFWVDFYKPIKILVFFDFFTIPGFYI